MNEREEYFRLTKKNDVHILSNRIPFKWNELLVWSSASFIFLLIWTGWLGALLIAVLSTLGYGLYRFSAWVFYSELVIDLKSGRVMLLKKLLGKTQNEQLITENFDPSRFEFTALTRSGKTKYLLSYRTHKSHELLVLKNQLDRDRIKKYFSEEKTMLSQK